MTEVKPIANPTPSKVANGMPSTAVCPKARKANVAKRNAKAKHKDSEVPEWNAEHSGVECKPCGVECSNPPARSERTKHVPPRIFTRNVGVTLASVLSYRARSTDLMAAVGGVAVAQIIRFGKWKEFCVT